MSVYRWVGWLLVALALAGLVAPAQQDATPAAGAPPTVTLAITAAAQATVTFEPTAPAAPPAWVSPTPDAGGAIVVIVQPGESLWIIAARAGLSLPDLLALNDLTEASIINPGDALVIGYVTPAAVGPEQTTPTATPPPPTPRPTETRTVAAVCLTAFDDQDRDGLHDPDEPLRAGVAFTVYNSDAVAANYITDGRSEPKCLTGLTPGEYRVTRSVTPGEVLTTEGNWSLNLTAGSELYQSFGSFMGAAALTPTADGQPTADGRPPTAIAQSPNRPISENQQTSSGLPTRLLAVAALFVGGLLLLGAVLILLRRQARRPREEHPSASADNERRFRNLDDLE